MGARSRLIGGVIVAAFFFAPWAAIAQQPPVPPNPPPPQAPPPPPPGAVPTPEQLAPKLQLGKPDTPIPEATPAAKLRELGKPSPRRFGGFP